MNLLHTVRKNYKSYHSHHQSEIYIRMGKDKKTSIVQHYVELLKDCKDPKLTRVLLKNAPDGVIKIISDAALNCYRGDIDLTPKQKNLLKKDTGHISKLISKKVTISTKRRSISQKGGFSWIPLLIGTALSALGPALFGNR